MSSRRVILASVAAAVGLTFAPILTQQASADVPPPQTALHNDSANSYTSGEGECAGLDADTSYWHFVLAPNSGDTEFVSIHLNLGDGIQDFVGFPPIIENGGQKDNVYVAVPVGYELSDLDKVGSYAIIDPFNAKTKFVLSHVCDGGGDENPVEELTVTKTAETSYTRTHNWSVDKNADKTEVLLYANGSGDGDVTWTIDVSYDGSTDSDFLVTGTITVTNTGDLPTSVASVVDELTLGGNAVDTIVVCPDLPVVLEEPGDFIECTYSATPDAADDGTNTVTATSTSEIEDADIVPVTWGDPSSEVNATVNLSDVMTPALPNGLDDQTLTAPNGDSFEYTNTFHWADYPHVGAQCVDHTYDNTATLKSGETILDEASESVTVRVQCLIFKGETAWAANANTANQLPYNKKGGNWATYVKYDGAAKSSTVFAGQTINVGTATFSAPVNNQVTITVTLTGGWQFASGGTNLMVQTYSSAPSGNPSPGLFAYKTTCSTASSTCSITVPKANFYGVHIPVGQLVPDPTFP